jgi:hypothetical protein
VVSFIGGGNQRKPLTCRKSLTNFITQCCIEYISPWAGLELTTLVVISTDCIGNYKSNCHTITTTRSPQTQLNGSVLSHVCVYLKTSPGITMYSQVKFACWLTVSWLVSHVKQEVLTLLEYLTSPSVFSWVRVARSIVMCLMFCRSLFVLLSFFFCPLRCLSFYLWLVITLVVYSNLSYSVCGFCLIYSPPQLVKCFQRYRNYRLM